MVAVRSIDEVKKKWKAEKSDTTQALRNQKKTGGGRREATHLCRFSILNHRRTVAYYNFMAKFDKLVGEVSNDAQMKLNILKRSCVRYAAILSYQIVVN